MKKLFCIIALGAISFGNVFAAVPVKTTNHTMQTDTTKMKKKKMKMKKKKSDTTSMKRDSTKM